MLPSLLNRQRHPLPLQEFAHLNLLLTSLRRSFLFGGRRGSFGSTRRSLSFYRGELSWSRDERLLAF